MRIRAKLQLSTIAALIVGISVILAILFSNNQVNRMVRESSAHGKLVQNVFALDKVLDDYLSYPDSLRVQHQWQRIYGSLGDLLKEMGAGGERSDSIEPLLESYLRLDPLVKQMAASQTKDEGAFRHAQQKEILTDQLSVNLTSMVTHASQALQLNQTRIIEAQKRAGNIMAFLMVALIVANGMIFFLLARKLTRSVLELHEGTRSFGSGNLGHRIAPRSSDEIGELGQAFNEMASRLSSTYAAMEAEMAERRRAEEALRELNESLERRVAERTALLEAANVQLQAEITERKRAKEALDGAHARLTTIMQTAQVAILVAQDAQCRQVTGNDFAHELLGVPKDGNLSATPGSSNPPAPWRAYREGEELPGEELPLQEAARTGRVISGLELEIVRAGGDRTTILCGAAPLYDSAGLVNGAVGTVLDITARKAAEEALRASLREKEVLLNEIHHRVKNNMQVISSLVSLQADELKDVPMRSILKDVTHRVRSMALVHEKLYQSADLARVEFAEYTESLLNYLWRAHGTIASGVRLTLDLEPVSLPVDTAVPCGLILNELVMNALKHAFRGRAGGEVSVMLRADTDSKVRLCVRDNGAGLPEGFDWKQARSLGLHLVQMLSRQLRATVEVKSIGGTEFEIAFKGSKT